MLLLVFIIYLLVNIGFVFGVFGIEVLVGVLIGVLLQVISILSVIFVNNYVDFIFFFLIIGLIMVVFLLMESGGLRLLNLMYSKLNVCDYIQQSLYIFCSMYVVVVISYIYVFILRSVGYFCFLFVGYCWFDDQIYYL